MVVPGLPHTWHTPWSRWSMRMRTRAIASFHIRRRSLGVRACVCSLGPGALGASALAVGACATMRTRVHQCRSPPLCRRASMLITLGACACRYRATRSGWCWWRLLVWYVRLCLAYLLVGARNCGPPMLASRVPVAVRMSLTVSGRTLGAMGGGAYVSVSDPLRWMMPVGASWACTSMIRIGFRGGLGGCCCGRYGWGVAAGERGRRRRRPTDGGPPVVVPPISHLITVSRVDALICACAVEGEHATGRVRVRRLYDIRVEGADPSSVIVPVGESSYVSASCGAPPGYSCPCVDPAEHLGYAGRDRRRLVGWSAGCQPRPALVEEDLRIRQDLLAR